MSVSAVRKVNQLYAHMLCCVQSLSRVQSFATPWTAARQAPLSMGALQARILEQVAMPSFRGSSQPRDGTQVSCIAGGFFTIWATREAQYVYIYPHFFGFPSHLGHHRALYRNSLVPVLYIVVYIVSIPVSLFFHPLLSPLASIHLFSTSVSLFLLGK